MSLRKEAPNVRVFVNGRENGNWQCLDVSVGSGANALPQATLELQPEGRSSGRRSLSGIQLARFPQETIEVVIGDRVVHWGKVFAQPATMDGRTGDRIRCVSRMDQHLFGDALNLAYFYDPRTRNTAGYTLPTVFNPDVDGRAKPNMSRRRDPRRNYRLFIHDQSTETSEAAEYNGSPTASYWTLDEAVFYLCWVLNPNQTNVLNPALGVLRGVISNDTSLLRNHTCPIGALLPEQLDRLLEPYGYSWTVDFIARGRRQIRVFERGQGVAVPLPLQAFDEILDVNASKVEELSLNPDVSSRAFNSLVLLGDYERYELTVELKRAWPEEYDERDLMDLEKNAEGWQNNTTLPNVWRKWVLNEAGDYNGTREDIGETPFNFQSLAASAWLTRRRRFEPCLTLNDDGSPQGGAGGVFVEWYDVTAGEWYPVDMLGPEGRQVRILEKECGIYFDGALPPLEIMLQASGAKVRVTATVASDRRMSVELNRAGRSLLADAKEEVVDVGSKYKFRLRMPSSRFSRTAYRSSDANDENNLRRLGNKLLNSWNRANLDGTVTLTGVEFDPRSLVGFTVSGIPGRRVDFNVSPEGRQYPTIVGMRLRIESQQTDITLDTFRGERI